MREYWVPVRCICTYKIKVAAELADNAASNAQDLLDEETKTNGGDLLPTKPDFAKDYHVEATALLLDEDDVELVEEGE